MTIKKESFITNEVKEQVLREYFKNRARKARHGDTETVEKRGRKRIPDELREEHRKNYYETILSSRQPQSDWASCHVLWSRRWCGFFSLAVRGGGYSGSKSRYTAQLTMKIGS